MNKEEKAIVLDLLPNGYPFDKTPLHKKDPIVQAIGTNKFSILELIPKKDAKITIGEEVYIGEDKRDKIHHIKGKIKIDKLTQTAKGELQGIIKKIINENQDKFLNFYNKARPLSTRMHSLELIPGLGKKQMWEIIEERRIEPFKSFEDLKSRIKTLQDPINGIVKRILKELNSDKEKHYLFTERPNNKEDY